MTTSRLSVELHAGLREGTGYLLPLECLRGVAILLVFLFHAWGISGLGTPDSPGLLLSFILSGSTGVTLFFVLSGFLLFLPWIETGGQQPSVRRYYVARVLRIVPLYAFAIAVAVVVTGQWEVGLRAAGFQFVGFELFPFSAVWWTLTTEFQFYLLLPLFGLAWQRRGPWRWLVVVCLLAWLVAYCVVFVLRPEAKTVFSYWLTKSLFGRLPAFLIGMAAALIFVRFLRAGAGQRVAGTVGLVLAVLTTALLGVVLRQAAVLGDWLAEWSWHLHHTWEALLWTLLVLLCLNGFTGLALLVNRAWAVLGKLSYSFYLWHVPVLYYLIDPIKTGLGEDGYRQSIWLWLIPLAAFLLTVLLSYVSYRWIELPFLNLKRQLQR